jgi:Zn finger protein HypA/HybF involved in hydrogenase expression
MHELSLATDIVEVALKAAGDSGRVTTVYVTLNSGSHLDESVLADAFEMAAAGTRLAHATLDVAMTAGDRGVATVTAIDVESEVSRPSEDGD